MSDLDFLQARFAQPFPVSESACHLASDLAAAVLESDPAERVFVLGISGAQGSGKSTLAQLVQALLAQRHGRPTVILSLDDFYLPKADRAALARSVHPLCATRGVAGTHDPALMGAVLEALENAGPDTQTALPRFDKLSDDRLPEDAWPPFAGRPACIIIEGWCVGLRPRHLAGWSGPVNPLEAEADPDGIWARWSMAELPAYEPLWDRIDLLCGILLPDMESVVQSRLRQEQTMVAAGGNPASAMDEAGVRRFVAHYERHTLALWQAFPQVADVLVRRTNGFAYERMPLS